jgi:hypothetical protein
MQAFLRRKSMARISDFEKAAAEILDSDAARKLPHRYARLAAMMRAG